MTQSPPQRHPRNRTCKPGLTIALIGVLVAGLPSLLGAEALREYWAYSAIDPQGAPEAAMHTGEAFIGVQLATALIVVNWLACVGAAVLVAVIRHLSVWRTVLPAVVAVPLAGTVFMVGGAAIAAAQMANLTNR